MNQKAASPTNESREQQIRLFGLSCNFKLFLAVILGLLSFLLLFGLGAALEGASLNELSGNITGKSAQFALTVASGIVIGDYFLIAQYFLSRGNPQPLRKAWPLVIALNFLLLGAPSSVWPSKPRRRRWDH